MVEPWLSRLPASLQIGAVDVEVGDPPDRVVLEAIDGRRLTRRSDPGGVDLGQVAVDFIGAGSVDVVADGKWYVSPLHLGNLIDTNWSPYESDSSDIQLLNLLIKYDSFP